MSVHGFPLDAGAIFAVVALGMRRQPHTEAARFFVGLPPADLAASNVTLASLTARIDALCAPDAPPTEFGLIAYRPHPARDDALGVAYQIVGTQCLLLNTS